MAASKILHVHHVQHGAENFLLRHGHAGLHVVENRRADEKAVGRFADFHAAAIGRNFRAFFHAGFDQFQHAVAMLARDDRAHVRLRFAVGRADFDLRVCFDERGQNSFLRRADDDGGRARHATFARAAERGFDDAARGIFHVGIRHEKHDNSSRRRWIARACRASCRLRKCIRNRRRADERNRFHLRMREQRVHHFASAVDDVQHAFGQAGFFQQLRDFDRGERNFFARLEHERVAARDGDGIHPQRHHRGKIERRDADANAERLADGFAINAARDVFQHLAHHQRRHAAARTRRFPCRASRRRAIRRASCRARACCCGRGPRNFPPSTSLKRKKIARALDRRRFHPRRKRGVRGFDGGVGIFGTAHRGFGDDFAGGRIVNRRCRRFWIAAIRRR